MVLLEFQMAPHVASESVSQYVAQILDIVDQSGVAYQLTPMGTILEGEWDEVMAVVKMCIRDRISTDRYIGARALWKPEGLHSVFLTFAEPQAIGLSSICLLYTSRCV